MARKTLTVTAFLMTALLTLTACGGEDDTSTASNAEFNDADVTFATEMIPHHQQAVEMAELAADRAQSPEVRQLAEDIEAAQGPEIETMTQWLKDWGQETPSGSMEHGDMGHGDSKEMPGMMDEAEMTQLMKSDGAAFDQMFLQMMVEHHEGAIEMARIEQANGKNADAVALAKQVESDQEAEVAKMGELLDS
jgi:uncharacterized protein (DUF305 family)